MSDDYEIGVTTEAGEKKAEKYRSGSYDVNPEDPLYSSPKSGLHYETGMTAEAEKEAKNNKRESVDERSYDVNPESPLYSSSKPRREVILVMRM